MNSTLPSRWQEILRREAANKVGNVLAQAKDQPEPSRMPRWTLPALVIGAASVSLLSLIGGTEARSQGGVPFDRATVLSTRTAGLGANAEDLAPRVATTAPLSLPQIPEPTPSAMMAELGHDHAAALPTPPPSKARKSREKCIDCDRPRQPAPADEATPDLTLAQPAVPPVPEKPAPLIVNVGTRLEAVLSDPVITGAALAPATARLAKDLYIGERLVVTQGTTLVGEAFATQIDDRAQIVFSAIVKDGKTVPFEGWALQQGEMGVRGKVVRKGSKAKKGASAVLGAAASALSYGLVGSTSGPEGAALASLGNTAANDLLGVGRDWRRSDKAVRIDAGVPIVVYIRRDLSIE